LLYVRPDLAITDAARMIL